MATGPNRRRGWPALLAVILLLAGAAVWMLRGRRSQDAAPASTPPAASATNPEAFQPGADPRTSAAAGNAGRPARIRIPRFVPAATAADAGAGDPGSVPRLARGSGQMTDRRPGRVPGAGIQVAALKQAMAAARQSAEACLERWPGEHPALRTGVMLAFNVDREGLKEVWIEGLPEIPDGPLRCLSEGIYQQDWSGLTDDPIMMSDKVRSQSPDARPSGR